MNLKKLIKLIQDNNDNPFAVVLASILAIQAIILFAILTWIASLFI